MRPIKSIKALANNIQVQGVRDAFHRLDEGQQELAAAIARLASGQQPSTSGTLVVGQPGGGTSGGSTGVGVGRYADIDVSNLGADWTVVSHGGVRVIPANSNLQNVINDLPNGGNILQLAGGNFYGPGGSAAPSTNITIPATKGPVQIRGLGVDKTIIKSPILSECGRFGLVDVSVKPAGTAYGVKIFRSGFFTSRCYMQRVWIGASYSGAGDGPVRGLILDGAGVFLAEGVTIPFCTSDGLLVDSTAAEPNTTLKFDMCSFVGNGGYGVNLQGSCSIAEFNGGNMEDNVSGEFNAANMNSIYLHGVDFETGVNVISNQITINNCNPVSILDCNFITGMQQAGDPTPNTPWVTRAILCAGSQGITIQGNRFSGWMDTGVIRIGETSLNARVGPNVYIATEHPTIPGDWRYPWVEDYSRP